MFNGFSDWDDDGYVLIGIRSLLRGRRLYIEVYSRYGPFYYLLQWIIHTATGLPASHDLQRCIGAAIWLGSAILWTRTVFLPTGSRL